MFEDTDFTVDEAADEYRALHPNAGHRAKAKTEEERLLQEHVEEVSARAKPLIAVCVLMSVWVCL